MQDFNAVFPSLPKPLLAKLDESYNEVKKNFREQRFEPSELNGAKFSEAVYRILEWHTSSSKQYTPRGTHIQNFGQSVRKFENVTGYPDSIRFHIPRILEALYVIRNKRGVGHLAGDIDPNYMDAVFVVSACDWVMAELVRLFHNTTPEEAQEIVQAIVTKKLPIVWNVGEVRRVLLPELTFKEKMLVLLYHEYPNSVEESKIVSWVEYSNPTVFRRDVLKPCHKKKLIEYNVVDGTVTLSPLGLRFVEDNISLET